MAIAVVSTTAKGEYGGVGLSHACSATYAFTEANFTRRSRLSGVG